MISSPHGAVDQGLAAAPLATATVIALVAHARAVPSAEREAFGERLRALPERADRIVVHTCHRVELYATGAGIHDLAELEVPPGARRLADVAAIEHLLTLACGLDSTVFGETQVLHQLRETLEDRHGDRTLDPVLDRLFQVGLRAGRDARSFFTGSPRSLADTALDRVEAAAGSIAHRTILVVGAGRMARLAALAAARRHARVVVANRTASRAADLAANVDGRVVPFQNALPLPDLAGIVVALGGPWPADPVLIARAVAAGAVVADLSSPPALPATTTDRLAAGYVSVDDFAATGEARPDDRTRARVERLVALGGAEYCRWLRARGSVPAIRQVVDTAEERRRRELDWLRHRLPDLADSEIGLIEQMSHRLVASILHAPLTALGADEDGALEPAARALFRL